MGFIGGTILFVLYFFDLVKTMNLGNVDDVLRYEDLSEEATNNAKSWFIFSYYFAIHIKF